jgi:hypothetical protein
MPSVNTIKGGGNSCLLLIEIQKIPSGKKSPKVVPASLPCTREMKEGFFMQQPTQNHLK